MTGPEALRRRYEDPERAARYARRSPRRDRREMRLLARLAAHLPPGLTILDVPAGTGRAARLLAARGHRVVAADASRAMLTAAAPPPRAAVGDAFRLPFRDHAFEALVCLRFLHHLTTPALRRSFLAECARVSRRYLLLSLRHPVALHGLRRRAGSLTVRACLRELAPFGYRKLAAVADLPFLREFWLLLAGR